ncbi:gluconokinase [Bacillus kexueae]|uniref:gluconokinase n=1 Tax=Aeribacillus kexueae TaxID=2078952 RepID=UPI001FB00FE5|nr:FGGY family carbohydrate kinase [Bacillus kexueae]
MKAYYIGVDIGTTSTKSVLFSLDGNERFKYSIEYPLFTSIDGTAEQNPEEVFQAVFHTIQACVHYANQENILIRAISFSSAMHSLILVDHRNQPITNLMTWADTRSSKWATNLKESDTGKELYQQTGTPIHTMTPLSKLIWLKNERPKWFEQAHKFISIKEYILFELFGEYVIDYATAGATGLMNLNTLTWDKRALSLVEVDEHRLSTIVPTTYLLPPMKESFRNALGLSPDTSYIIGASDGVLSNLGVNAIQDGVVALTIGTSGAIRTVVSEPTTEENGSIFCYPLTTNNWVIGGPVNNGGVILRWLKELFECDYETLNALAKNVPPGADRLFFHPYLTGERAPIWNSDAKGSFFGLTLNHGKPHITRAVMEGVIFNLYTVMTKLKPFMKEPKCIRASGGFANSPLWCQMVADIFQMRVEIPSSIESSSYGAVLLAGYALGDIHTFERNDTMDEAMKVFCPNNHNVREYEKLFPMYEKIQNQLTPLHTEHAHI